MRACPQFLTCGASPSDVLPRPHRPQPVRRRARRAGLTLVEVVIATAIAATTGLAALAGMLMSLRTADSNLLALHASAAVRSIGEQLQGIDYLTLFSTELPVDVPSHRGGSLVVDAWNTRSDDLHHTPNNPRDDLKLRVRPYVTRITQADGGDFAQVVLFYEWEDSSFFVARTRSDAFTMIIAPVSSY